MSKVLAMRAVMPVVAVMGKLLPIMMLPRVMWSAVAVPAVMMMTTVVRSPVRKLVRSMMTVPAMMVTAVMTLAVR
ncbi:MAG TPA: hypothetical protein VGG64_12430 [Pirellulales bacterium]|jgi:hypothetical protein